VTGGGVTDGAGTTGGVTGRAAFALAVGVACALHISVTGQVVIPALAMLIGLGATVAGPRLTLAQASQALIFVGTVLFTFVAVFVDVPLGTSDGGPKVQYAVASGAALLTVAARLWMRNPERGDLVTWGIGLVVFYSCGRVTSPQYLPLVVAYLGLAWLHAAAASGVGSHRSRRHVALALALVVSSALLAGGTALGLRKAYTDINEFAVSRAVGGEVGFGAGAFQLSSMDGMRDSDEVILRVHGPAPEHFRGQAYNEYKGGVWFPPAGKAKSVPRGASPTGEVTTLEFVSTEQKRLFLPMGSGAVWARPSGLRADALGVPRPANASPTEVRFDMTGPARLPAVDPTDADLALDPAVAAAIGPLVDRWVAGADTPRARIAAIQARLEQDYTYSLHYERRDDADPVVQFLLESRLGHCEYFASAGALSARYAGVPARVVTGFRATETSPFGGHRIVRSRDAHAWVEVYLDGGWELLDPSPQNSLEAGPTRAFLSGALDDLARAWSQYGPQVVIGILLVIFVGLQIRTLARRRKAPVVAPEEGWVEGPPDWLRPLLDQLAEAELVRGAAESVEGFAQRVRAGGETSAGELLRQYAELRYGPSDDDVGLAAAVGAWRPAERG
jgi:protein-glutamine gamma-glutamyltransferase